jgi:hypothetical protein
MNRQQTIVEMLCEQIGFGERLRKDVGGLEALAACIAAEGLLQPVGITEANLQVFGERRLLADRDVLKQATISARIVRVSSILAGEYAENEFRKGPPGIVQRSRRKEQEPRLPAAILFGISRAI